MLLKPAGSGNSNEKITHICCIYCIPENSVVKVNQIFADLTQVADTGWFLLTFTSTA
jgi:hypothetical protein